MNKTQNKMQKIKHEYRTPIECTHIHIYTVYLKAKYKKCRMPVSLPKYIIKGSILCKIHFTSVLVCSPEMNQ